MDIMEDIDLIRLLIPDLDEDNQLFTDDELTGFLGIYRGSIQRAAAAAIDSIANNEVLLFKVIKTDDLSVNGAVAADALRKRAISLREEADAVDGEGVTDGFQIVYPNAHVGYPEVVPRPLLWG